MYAIIKFLDDYLKRTGLESIDPVQANALLAKAGLLRDSKDRQGKPLRDLLRNGKLPHAFQSGGKGSSWIIPHSTKGVSSISNYTSFKENPEKRIKTSNTRQTKNTSVDILQLKKRLEEARQKYKPARVRCLLIAEAPPDSLERFFYYENVRKHDYLFLGVAEALYPSLKKEFIANGRDSSIKQTILLKLQDEGFFLIDLSELPLSLLNSSLISQLPALSEKINSVADNDTQIILIKANVYDIAFQFLNRMFENVINQRIAFPGQGGQRKFQIEFEQALKLAGHL